MSVNERLDKMLARDVRTAAAHSGERGVYVVAKTGAKTRGVVSWNEMPTALADLAGEYGHEGSRRESDFVIPSSVCHEPAIDDVFTIATGRAAGTWTVIEINSRDAGGTAVRCRWDIADRANAAGARSRS